MNILIAIGHPARIHLFKNLIWELKNRDYEVIYSSGVITTVPISYYKKELERYTKVPFPDYDKMLMTHDKAKTIKFAMECGIPVPRTYFVENREELEEISNMIEYPVVVKPRCKTTWNNGKPTMLKVTAKNYVTEKRELIEISDG